MAVRVVTDSTCDLPPSLVKDLGLTVVPLTVRFGDQAYLDGVEIDAPTFYHRLASSDVTPATSQPSVEAFETVYRELSGEADAIVSVHISSKLSGTLNSASVARETLGPEAHIDLIDSYTACLALGEVAREAAAVAANGGTRDQVIDAARETMGRVSVIVALETLEYLRRGGRIGRASSLFGTALSIKPLVHVEDGEVSPLERVRTRKKAIARLEALATEDRTIERLYVGGGGNPEEVSAFADRVRPLLPHTEIIESSIGPVVGVHTGPGAIGIAPVKHR